MYCIKGRLEPSKASTGGTDLLEPRYRRREMRDHGTRISPVRIQESAAYDQIFTHGRTIVEATRLQLMIFYALFQEFTEYNPEQQTLIDWKIAFRPPDDFATALRGSHIPSRISGDGSVVQFQTSINGPGNHSPRFGSRIHS
jgi:hypothetical protein